MNYQSFGVFTRVAAYFVSLLLFEISEGGERLFVTYADFSKRPIGGRILEFDVATGDFVRVFADNLRYPTGITTGSDGFIYVRDHRIQAVLRFDPELPNSRDVFAEDPADGSGGDIEFGPDGKLYVLSESIDGLWRFDGQTGEFLEEYATDGAIFAGFGIDFGPTGDLFVSTSIPHDGPKYIKQFEGSSGSFLGNVVDSNLSFPTDVEIGRDGAIYVNDGAVLPAGVKRFDGKTGEFIDVFASPEVTRSSFVGIKFNASGDLFIADFGGDIIRVDGTSGERVDVLSPPEDLGSPLYMTFIDELPDRLEIPSAIFNPTTGGIEFRNVANVISLRIQSKSGQLLTGRTTDLDGNAACENSCMVDDQTPNFIEWTNTDPYFEFDRAFAGNLYAPGTPFEQVLNDIEFTFTSFMMQQNNSLAGEFTLVPEPITLMPLGIGSALLSLSTCRRVQYIFAKQAMH